MLITKKNVNLKISTPSTIASHKSETNLIDLQLAARPYRTASAARPSLEMTPLPGKYGGKRHPRTILYHLGKTFQLLVLHILARLIPYAPMYVCHTLCVHMHQRKQAPSIWLSTFNPGHLKNVRQCHLGKS